MAAKDHARVSPEGKAIGASTARFARLGRQLLDREGLSNLNLPGARDEMCASCACRPGTVPNGCLQTQLDFLKAVVDGKQFLCHAPLDGRMCAGYVAARAQQVATPMPEQITNLLAKHEYSPPDDDSASTNCGGAAA